MRAWGSADGRYPPLTVATSSVTQEIAFWIGSRKLFTASAAVRPANFWLGRCKWQKHHKADDLRTVGVFAKPPIVPRPSKLVSTHVEETTRLFVQQRLALFRCELHVGLRNNANTIRPPEGFIRQYNASRQRRVTDFASHADEPFAVFGSCCAGTVENLVWDVANALARPGSDKWLERHSAAETLVVSSQGGENAICLPNLYEVEWGEAGKLGQRRREESLKPLWRIHGEP